MKYKISALILFCSTHSFAQFDNVKSRYESDSSFIIHIDSSMRSYCDINPISSLDNIFTKIKLNSYTNYGYQPYEILHSRDSSGIKLPAVLGLTNTATANFTLIGDNGNVDKTISITDINSNYYTSLYLYKAKFLYWLISEKLNFTIK